MRNLFFASACLLTIALAGCQQTPPANDQLDAVLWTQTSIEHELIYRQLFANATRQLDVALADPSWDALPFAPRNLAGLPPAVVVDIDADGASDLAVLLPEAFKVGLLLNQTQKN